MAAPVGFVGRRFTLKSSPILLLSRGFAAKRFRRKRKLAPYESLKLQDNNVYLLSDRDPPKHSFAEALSALRAYNISLSGITDQIVELHVRVDMGEKKVSNLYEEFCTDGNYSTKICLEQLSETVKIVSHANDAMNQLVNNNQSDLGSTGINHLVVEPGHFS